MEISLHNFEEPLWKGGVCDSETWEVKEIDGGSIQCSTVTGEDLRKCLVSNCCPSREGLWGNH